VASRLAAIGATLLLLGAVGAPFGSVVAGSVLAYAWMVARAARAR
jgi:hypothetical protein